MADKIEITSQQGINQQIEQLTQEKKRQDEQIQQLALLFFSGAAELFRQDAQNQLKEAQDWDRVNSLSRKGIFQFTKGKESTEKAVSFLNEADEIEQTGINELNKIQREVVVKLPAGDLMSLLKERIRENNDTIALLNNLLKLVAAGKQDAERQAAAHEKKITQEIKQLKLKDKRTFIETIKMVCWFFCTFIKRNLDNTWIRSWRSDPKVVYSKKIIIPGVLGVVGILFFSPHPCHTDLVGVIV